MRKILEQENICASLKGRLQYFATRYRGAHDQTGRVAIHLDGKEILKSDSFDWSVKQHDNKRIGKRRLQKLVPEVEAQPEWLQSFYRLRMEAGGIAM